MGLAESFGAGVNAVGGIYQNQMMRDTLQTYPQLLQAQLGMQQANTGIAQNTLNYAPQNSQQALLMAQQQNQWYGRGQQANIGLTNAQATQANANAGYIGTETGKNQWMLNHPELMIPGIAGQIGGINTLKQIDPSIFGNTSSNAPTQPTGGLAAPPQQSIPQPFSNGGVPSNGASLQQNTVPANAGPNQMPTSGLAAPLSPPQNAIQAQVQGSGQMFGGNPVANQMVNSIFAPMQQKAAQTAYYNARASGFNMLPPDGKAQLISQTNSFGYSPDEAASLLTQGYTLQQLAAAKGYTDPNNYPAGEPSPTSATRTRTQLRNSSMAELDAMQGQITAALAPYSQRIAGYSGAQLAQAISGSDPDAQARFIAAKALTPDINALRTKIAGGQYGIGMNEELQDQAMNNFKTLESTVTPAVYAKAQTYIEGWLKQANASANKTIYNPTTGAAMNPDQAETAAGDRVRVVSPDGKTGTIPSDQLGEALKSGFKQAQ